jgi:hypothetical protein
MGMRNARRAVLVSIDTYQEPQNPDEEDLAGDPILSIDRYQEPQNPDEEQVVRRDYEGNTRSTNQFLADLARPSRNSQKRIKEFQVHWTSHACNDWKQIRDNKAATPPPHRQHRAITKFVVDRIAVFDQKLRAIALLLNTRKNQRYELRYDGFRVLFRVDPGRSIVRVEQVSKE